MPIEMIVGGVLGYLLGQKTDKEWEKFKEDINKRMNHIAYLKITIPHGLFSKMSNCYTFFSEAVRAYIYGLANASVPMFFKCLEMGLKKKYEEIENKPPKNLDMKELIDWSEKFLGNKKELAQGFRLVRNIIHENSVIIEQDVPQIIYNVSKILNLIYTYDSSIVSYTCNNCNSKNTFPCLRENNFLGNVMLANCKYCQTAVNLRIFT